MQVLTKRYPKNCLLTVMERYSATVHNMEQVVLMPSLLRDVLPNTGPDLHHCFTMLKAICVDVEHGLLPRDKWQAQITDGDAAQESEAEVEEEAGEERPDLEAQFHLHFSRLHHILTHLTLRAEEVTQRYKEITGQAV